MLAVGMDLCGTNLRWALIDPSGEIRYQRKAPTPRSLPEKLEAVRSALQEVELDFQLGNIAQSDYNQLRNRYMQRALVALKQRYEREQEFDTAIEEQLRRMRMQEEHSETTE